MDDLIAENKRLKEAQEKRKIACRKASKKYYDKMYNQNNIDTCENLEDLDKLQTRLAKREQYQKDYYEKNKDKIRERHAKYRKQKKEELASL